MRRATLVLSLLACLVGTAHAERKTPKLSSTECGLSTPYNVQVDGGGVWLYRHDGAPKEIFFHDGTLSVDRRVQPVSDADAQRLRRMEDGARALMPEVAGIARDSIDITYDALAGAVRAVTGSEGKARKVERYRRSALAHVGASLGNGRWDQDVFDAKFQRDVEDGVESIATSIVRSALWQALTGRGDAMEARADRFDAEMDARLDARTAVIEAHAKALCTQVVAQRGLQDALEYRYNGAPLVMLSPVDDPERRAVESDVAADADATRQRNAITVAGRR